MMIGKRLSSALAALALAICGVSNPVSAEIVTVDYTFGSTNTPVTAVFDATQQGATNVYDLNSVVDYLVNGVSVNDAPYTLLSALGNPNASLALDGSSYDLFLYSGNGSFAVFGDSTDGTAVGSASYGGVGFGETFVPANFSASVGPGAPAPLLGLGLLPALAGLGGIAATRRRRKAALSPALS